MKTSFVRGLIPMMLILSITLAPATTFADETEVLGVLLTGALDLTYVGNLEKMDDDGRLLVWEGSIGGDFAGKTVIPHQSDGMWDGHGIVTEAYGKFARFKGFKVSETGPVIYGSNPPDSLTGTGMFQIY